jgi:RecG-like helicase
MALAASAQVAIAPERAEIYKPDDLAKLRALAGHRVTVEGTIVASGQSKSGSVCYLNFTRDRDKAVALVFFTKQSGDAAMKQKLDPFVGKKVRASGKLAEYKGSLEVQVNDLGDIQVIP